MQKYDIMGVIGEGAYGVVLKCKSTQNQEIIAIKKFKETEQDEIVKKTTVRQVKILKMVKHPNIVELKEAFRKKGIVYLVFQYVQNNLLQVLERSPDGLDPQLIRSLMYQLLKGLAYLHSLNIMHRDVKLQNLLISDRKELKICDFGFARHIKKAESQDQLTDYVATRWYRPPELLVGAHYSKEIDIWAVGCILGQLIDGNPMFPGQNQLDQLFLIQKCLGNLTSDHYQTFLKNPRYLGMKFPQIHNLQTIDKRYLGKFSPKGLNFLKQLLKMRPSDRLTAYEALKHPYFDGIREDDFIKKLSTNTIIKQEIKLGGSIDSYFPQEQRKAQRKKYSNANNLLTEKQRAQETATAHEFNRSTKINLQKKPKEDIIRVLNSKGVNGNGTAHSKSMVKGGAKNTQKQIKQKNISLEKHQNRDVLTKTQAGFYIQSETYHEPQHSALFVSNQNKIYNAKSPKPHINKSKKMPLNTQQIMEEDESWQSPSQLPLIMIGQKQKLQKSNKFQSHIPANIIITNSTFNYKTHH